MPICSVVKPSVARTPHLSTYKYWKKRHVLFSKFDQGILMDEESFPETLSAYMAEKCDRVKVAVDPFCGVGGNIIQLARLFDKVIAVDIDVDKIVMAKQNAAIYGVLEKLRRLSSLLETFSPPWGGPEYNKMDVIENVFI
ncbi:trimethylguanosine synthase-like [Metopolophium dirhodum]|uniref:trimethylguanosine synthase-like n=1 Tax=Metopolophium dirhodum TaxID=44670 RepID=UPI00298FDE7E|nr:trimethylguanosine synthase-like [Metopolophium dirhodum]